jgi:hypothetical protein
VSKNGLHRHYDKLRPEERFRLDVLAMARGDGQESERLVSSCPKFSYTMTDNAFSGLWLGAMDVTLRVYIEMAARLERLHMVGMLREVLPYQDRYARQRVRDAYLEGHGAGARQAWRVAGAEGLAPELPRDGIDEAKVDELAALGASIMPEILDQLERQQATEALTVWRGFGTFTDEALGLDPLKVLQAVFEPGAERIEGLEATAERLGLEADAGRAAEIGAELLGAWRAVRGRAA